MPLRSFLASACLAAACLSPGVAAAQEPSFVSRHNDWSVYVRGEGEAKVCYALATPEDARPGNVNHGDVYFLVSSWASGAAREQPSFMAGYELRPASPPEARVGSERVDMYVDAREGFVEGSRDEARLVRAMRRGAEMRVEAVSARGTATAYTFSLMGVTAALNAVDRLCG